MYYVINIFTLKELFRFHFLVMYYVVIIGVFDT